VTPPPDYFGDTQDSLAAMPADRMGPARARTWSEGQISHHVSPAVGWLRLDLHEGKGITRGLERLEKAYGAVGDAVAKKFGRGITRERTLAPDPEDHLASLRFKPGTDMSPGEIKDWVVLEFQDRLTPLRDQIVEDGEAGQNTLALANQFMATAKGFGSDIASKFRPALQRTS
jgi:hypothetical protein